MRKLLIIWLAGLVTMTAPAAVTVSNVSVAQIEGTKLVDITYDVASTETNTVAVRLEVRNADTSVNAPSLSGHIGTGLATGTNKTIIWNAGADWGGNVAALAYTVTVDEEMSEPPGMPEGGDPRATSWEVASERWVKNTYADGAVTMSDRTTGLMWVYDASANGKANWNNAMAHCNNLLYAGHGDWFLPNKYQLSAMCSQKEFFKNVYTEYPNHEYWSSTTNIWKEFLKTSITMHNGLDWPSSSDESYWVWPCRNTIATGSATASTDTRDYTLTVASARGGNPVPGIGTHSGYCWQSTVTPSVEVTVGGYACTGWTGAGSIPATGTTHTTGPIVLNTVVSEITWQWAGNPYTVTFDSQGGTVPSPASKVVTFDATYDTLATTTREGYTFDGWWTGADGTGTEVTAVTPVTSASNHMLYANWIEIYRVLNVTAEQLPGTKTVVIGYDLAHVSFQLANIKLEVRNGDTVLSATNLTGDIGVGVAIGMGKQIIWNMGTDWSGNVATGVTFVVIAETAGDPRATSWERVNDRWVKNVYADEANTMSDPTTGLMWVYDASANGTANRDNAIAYCDNLVYAGHSDWFLPGVGQIHAMYNQKALFMGVQVADYWSSTPYDTGYDWYWGYGVSMKFGYFGNFELFQPLWIWPCRLQVGGATGSSSAAADIDSRDYTLEVRSAHGNSIPAVGTHNYVWRTAVTPSVEVTVGGYTCTGWIGTGSIPASGATNTTGEIVLNEVASSIIWKWTANSYTVTLDTKGGTVTPQDKTVIFNAAYGLLPTPTRTGYTFGGWWTGVGGTGKEVTAATLVNTAANHTLYAKWLYHNLTNLTVGQLPGTKTVVISYDIASDLLAYATITLEIRDGETVLPAASLTGDIGTGVAMGTGKQIVWNMGADWDGKVAAGVTFTVKAGPGVDPDPTAVSWEEVNARWLKNTYANGAVTMSDRNTGLMWVYDASANGKADWASAIVRCDNVDYAEHSDWFLPNLDQLRAMYSQKAVFTGVQADWYWSRTSYSSGGAYLVNMGNGSAGAGSGNKGIPLWVWPCRYGQGGGGQPPAGMVLVPGGAVGGITVPPFCIGRNEVTWGEWQTVRIWAASHGYDIGNVGNGSGTDYPVHSVSWFDVVKWCNAKSEQESRTPVYSVGGVIYRSGENNVVAVNRAANGYRLPTGDDWEYAARGGNMTLGYTYSGGNDLNAVGWWRENSGYSPHTVGTKVANELGLHDMTGNVYERCWDADGEKRMFRGGSCDYYSIISYYSLDHRVYSTPI
jgi:uncharacterized repeat protein (TIGR02543 family)